MQRRGPSSNRSSLSRGGDPGAPVSRAIDRASTISCEYWEAFLPSETYRFASQFALLSGEWQGINPCPPVLKGSCSMRTEIRFARPIRAGVYVAYVAAMLLMVASARTRADEPRALVVGGGPDPKNNQVAIESNVRYVLKLLPRAASRTVLFADGNPKSETVLFEGRSKEIRTAERVLALLLEGRYA